MIFYVMLKRLTKEEFIERARNTHGNKYDYSKVNYINSKTKVCIICPKHGEFWQTPASHIYGKGCPKCGGRYMSTEYFIEKASIIHSNKYDYSKVNYTEPQTKVCIICPNHGEFWQTPNSHLNGNGCPKCKSDKAKSSKDKFIEKSIKVHSDKYDYSKVEYVNNSTKVCIICPEHGEFYIRPHHHICGRGCPKCLSSKLENIMRMKLNEMNIDFEEQKTFDWLIYKIHMKLDFYIPKYNIAIECQGEQHYRLNKFFGGEEGFYLRKYKDELKRKQCKEHNVNLLYFNYNDDINEFEQKLKEYGIH